MSRSLLSILLLLIIIVVFVPAKASESLAPTSGTNNFKLCMLTGAGCPKPMFNKSKTGKGVTLTDKPSQSETQQCKQLYASGSKAYNQALLNYLSATNQAVDNLRAQAENNGESYQTFDQQVNQTTAQYNVKALQLYQADNLQLSKCALKLASPYLFKAFSP